MGGPNGPPIRTTVRVYPSACAWRIAESGAFPGFHDAAAVTATFRVFYIFVMLDVGTRHPARDCDRPSDGGLDVQQFRMVVSGNQPHRWLIHDRDRIYSEGIDATVAAMGLTILETPVRAAQANAYCETARSRR